MSEETPQLESDSSEPMMDPAELFLSSAADGDEDAVARLLAADPTLLLSTDDGGNSALHLAAKNQREAVVARLLNGARAQGASMESALVDRVNNEGQTALDLSLQRRHRKISWTIIRSGGSDERHRRKRVSSTSLLQALPDFENGNNFLHVFARSNYALQIKEYLDSCDSRSTFVRQCLLPNQDGDTPAMVAARRGHKEALLALLQPFIVFPEKRELDRLLHTENLDGHRLLTYVSHFDKTLVAVHAVLVELETFAHGHDQYLVRECFRRSLGSTMSAKISTELFKRIRHKSTAAGRSCLMLKILSISFVIKTIFLVLDLFTDTVLVMEYYDLWGQQTSSMQSAILFGGRITAPRDPCKSSQTVTESDGSIWSSHIQATNNITFGCYPGAIDGKTRFTTTLFFLLLPFTLYFFELLRFRVLSSCLERRYGTTNCIVMYVIKPIGNALLWITWPVVAFFRLFWYRYRYEASEGEGNIHRHRRATLIGSRAQLIEVCTESSLQPLFQFYLVFQEILQYDFASSRSLDDARSSSSFYSMVSEGLAFVLDAHRRQVASVIVSLLLLAVSFTTQYRLNKENSVSLFATAVYFTSVTLQVTARILCFELFAYYLGPGQLHLALAAAAVHAVLMSFLHFAFSDSLAQCSRTKGKSVVKWARQILLVGHNCLLNGLANLYVHNNLEIFVKSNQSNKSSLSDEQHGQQLNSDVRQRTFVRQLVFDAILLVENVIMIFLARDHPVTVTPNYAKVYMLLVGLASACYFAGMALKVVFYLSCHPWAELIRPRRTDGGLKGYATSCVVFSRHYDLKVDPRSCNLQMASNRRRDVERYRSIRHLLPSGFNVDAQSLGKDTPERRSSNDDEPAPSSRILEETRSKQSNTSTAHPPLRKASSKVAFRLDGALSVNPGYGANNESKFSGDVTQEEISI